MHFPAEKIARRDASCRRGKGYTIDLEYLASAQVVSSLQIIKDMTHSLELDREMQHAQAQEAER